MIDLTSTPFTPGAGLLGGALIGLSAVLMMLWPGRIAGCSGIFRSLLTLKFDGDFQWRGIFLVGLMVGAAAAAPFSVNAQNIGFNSPVVTALGGIFVGFGTALAHGCTSGHGICGLARFSPRSVVAVITFMIVAMITVFVMRHGAGV
jgi:uncharacterized membrane protein YedE/YeeE